MKYLFSIFFLASLAAKGQEYISVTGNFYPNAGSNYVGGGFVSAGKYISGATIGLGMGLIMFETNEPYVPLFVDFGYIGKKKIAPYINVKMGWALYEGPADFIGEKETMKGGIFTNLAAGGNYEFAKNFRVAIHGGLTALMLRQQLITRTETFSSTFFNAGLSLIYARP